MTSTIRSREDVTTDLQSICKNLRKAAVDKKAEVTRASAGDDLGTYLVEQAWTAQANAKVWAAVDYRMKQSSLDMIDAVIRVRAQFVRELVSQPRDLGRDLTTIIRDHDRDNARRMFLRETKVLVTTDLGLPACDF